MAHELFGPEWVEAWRGAIHASDDYRDAARRWEWSLLLVLRADPKLGIAGDRHVFLDLPRGECREARIGSASDTGRAAFVLSAEAETWYEVVAGRLDVVAGIARGQLRLEKGSLLTLTMHAGAAKALIRTAVRVPGDWRQIQRVT